jgi:hypothetical protein
MVAVAARKVEITPGVKTMPRAAGDQLFASFEVTPTIFIARRQPNGIYAYCLLPAMSKPKTAGVDFK